MTQKKTSIIIAVGTLVVIISMGLRQSFGIFLQPISQDLGVGREIFSLAMAIQNLLFGLPLVGIIADRVGARWAILAGGLIYGSGLLFLSFANTQSSLYLTLGLLVGFALSATSYVVVLGAVAQVVPPHTRSRAFGIITAAGSFGMFAVVPGAQWLLSNLGWQASFRWLAVFVGLIVLLAFGFPGNAPDDDQVESEPAQKSGSLFLVLSKARRHSGYLLLNAGFFVCGFHVAFIATHLPAFLSDNALSPMVGASALAMIGFFNIIGSYIFGALGDRFRKKFLLSLLYIGRAVVIALFLLLPITNISAILFGGAIGFLWLATVPLTSGMVAQIFGSRYLSTLYGIVFLSHQIGSFLGVWWGGRVYDATGSYNPVWVTAIALGIFAAIVHLPISDGAVVIRRQQPLSETA